MPRSKTGASAGRSQFTCSSVGVCRAGKMPPALLSPSFRRVPLALESLEPRILLSTGSIGDKVFEDLNGNGIYDAGEPGIANVAVKLYHDADGDGWLDATDVLVHTTVTDANGEFAFNNLEAGDYLVWVGTNNAALKGYVPDPDQAQYSLDSELEMMVERIWGNRQPYFITEIHSHFAAQDPYVLYDVQLFTNNALRYAGLTRNIALLSAIAETYHTSFDYLTLESEYVYYYWPGFARESIHTLEAPARMWLGDPASTDNGVLGVESTLVSSQFLYACSNLINYILDVPAAERTDAMNQFVTDFTPVILTDHYARWVLADQGIFQVKGWGGPSGLFNHREFLQKKLDHWFTTHDPTPVEYEDAITDTDMWILAGVVEMLSAHAKDPGLVPMSGPMRNALLDYVAVGNALIADRLTDSALTDFEGNPITGVNLDLGAWDEHPDHAYSGYTGDTSPLGLPENPADNVAWDVSHARRLVQVFNTLFEHRDVTGSAFPSATVMQKLANQLIYGASNKDPEQPLLTNFMDGTNGWYRVGYHGEDDPGVGPYGLTAALVTGGYGFWSSYNYQVGDVMDGMWNVIQNVYARDVSGNARHVIVSGGVWDSEFSGGGENGYMTFDGVDDYFDAGADQAFCSAQGTIEFWFRPDEAGRAEDLVNIFQNSYYDFLLVRRLANNRIQVYIEDDDAATLTLSSTATVTVGAWNHVAIVQDGAGVKIYINGQQSAVTGTNSDYWTDHLAINGAWVGKGHWSALDGAMDDIRFYNTALSAAEVQNHYATGTADDYGSDALLARWTFDDEPDPDAIEFLTTYYGTSYNTSDSLNLLMFLPTFITAQAVIPVSLADGAHATDADAAFVRQAASAWATLPNAAPTAFGDSFAIVEDTPISGVFAATDSDGDDLTFRIATAPTKGTVLITDLSTGAFTYTPNANVFGSDSFTFIANDGLLDSNTATITVTISAVNDPPELTVFAVLPGGLENHDMTITYAALTSAGDEYDVEGDPISFRIESVVSGTLRKNGVAVVPGVTRIAAGESLVWSPPRNTHGTLGVAYVRAWDGQAASETSVLLQANVTETTAPTAYDGAVTTPEDTPVSGFLAAADPDDDPLAYTVVALPTKGRILVTNAVTGAFVYTPDPNVFGTDTFSFLANDGRLNSNTATITVTITPVNDAPMLASFDTLAGATQDEPFAISYGTLLAISDAYDVDGDTISFRIESVVSGTLRKNGVAVVPGVTRLSAGESLVWTPAPGAWGKLPVAYLRVWDGAAASVSQVLLEVQVARLGNTAPVAQDAAVATDEGAAVSGMLPASDAESDALYFSIVAPPTLGQVAITDTATGAFTYTPNPNVFGTDTFTFQVYDGSDYSNIATLTVTIAARNDAPQWTGFTPLAGALQNQALTISYADLLASSNAWDADGDALSFRIESVASGALTMDGAPVVPGVTLVSAGSSLLWMPAQDAHGTLPVAQFSLWDGHAASAAPALLQAEVAAYYRYLGSLPGGGTSRVHVYDVNAVEDIALSDIVVKPGKGNTIASITLRGAQAMDGLGLVITGADAIGSIKDSRKAPGAVAFLAADAPVKSVALKSGISGYNLNGLTLAGWTFANDLDGDGDVCDKTALYGAFPVQSIAAANALQGDIVIARNDAKGVSLGALKITTGGMSGDVFLSGDLKRASVAGAVSGQWHAGRFGTVAIEGSFSGALRAAVSAPVPSGVAVLASLSIKGGDLSGVIEADGPVGAIRVAAAKDRATNLPVGGNLDHAALTLGALRRLTVSGWLDASRVACRSLVESVTVGGMRDSVLFVGVAGAADANGDGVPDLPTPPSDFTGVGATLQKFRMTGIRGAPCSWINSNVAAWALGSGDFLCAQSDNGGVAFGLALHTYGSLRYRNAAGRVAFSQGAAIGALDGDAEVRIG